MLSFEKVVFLCFLNLGLSEASGSSSFLQSTWSLLGIAVFTVLIGALLVYSCLVDIKHWRKSIDGRAQLQYPNAAFSEFQLPPVVQEVPDNLATSLEPNTTKRAESSQIERSPEEKTLRIVKAMYTASNRDVPQSVQKSLQSKSASHQKSTQKTPVILSIISERDSEKEQKSNTK